MKKFKLLFAILLLPLFMFGQVDYGKQAQDALDKTMAATRQALKHQKDAVTAAANSDCAAANAAADAAEKAATDANAAATAAEKAAENGIKTVTAFVQDKADDAADAARRATSYASQARTAANGCVPKPQEPDYVKQAQDAQKTAEAARDEAKKQKDLAETYANAGDCDAAKKAADDAKKAADAAKKASDDATAAYLRAATDAKKAVAVAASQTYYAAKEPADHAEEAAFDAAKAVETANAYADSCKPKSPPASSTPAPSKISMVPTGGVTVGAAQPNATIGYCYREDGIGPVPIYQNSNITAGTLFGMLFYSYVEARAKEELGSLERPRSPYASFASYHPSAKVNAGPALPPTAQGAQLNLMSLNLGVNYLRLKGEDRHPERGASFDKKMVEVLATGDFYFVNLLRAKRATKAPKVSPFVRLGAGFGIGDPNTDNGEQDTKKANFALPMGLGFRVDVSSMVSLNFDYTTRATFSDALDGVTSSTGGKDWYGAGGVGLSFMLGKKANDSDGDGVKNNDDPCPTVAGTLGGCPDTDGDGLADKEDTCPNEAGDQRFGGCPDSDGDGVANNLDDCPDNAGLRRFSGCPDTDGDNIIDKEDRCPTVPGLAAINGCPDADRDGVTDDKDDCPDAPGPAEQNGCPDTDNDGIADNKDECPEAYGLAKFQGCPDTDNDGLADPQDRCPNLKGPASNEGCPEIDAEDKAVLDKAMRNVKFRSSSAELLPASRKDLDQIAEVMSRYKGYKLSIDGYTDNEGPAASNQSLSEARARACYDYLSGIGVRLSQMVYAGHGPTSPIGDNNTKEGRLRNRRVEFTLNPQ